MKCNYSTVHIVLADETFVFLYSSNEIQQTAFHSIVYLDPILYPIVYSILRPHTLSNNL